MGAITSLADVLAALRRRAVMIGLIALLGVPLALWFAMKQPKLYEATAVIQIEAPQVAGDLTLDAGVAAPDQQLNLIQQQIMARDAMAALVDGYGLFAAIPSMTEKVALLRGAVAIQRLVDPATAGLPGVAPTGLMVTVRLDDPVTAAAIANDVVARIVAEAEARNTARADRTLTFILAEEARVNADIAAVEDRITTFREENLAALPEGLTAQRDRLTRLTEQRITVDRDLIALETATDRLRGDEADRQRAALSEQRDILLRAIAETEAAIAAAPEVERQLNALSRDLTRLEAELTVLTERRTEAAMSQQLSAQDSTEQYVVLETAVPPEFSTSASRRKVALTVAVAVAGMGVALAMGLEILNPAIRSATQLQRELGVQAVIVVPRLSSPSDRWRRRFWWAGVVLAGLATVAALLQDRLTGWFGAGRVVPARLAALRARAQ